MEMLKLQGHWASVTEAKVWAVNNELREREQEGNMEARSDIPGKVFEAFEPWSSESW